MNEPQEKSNAAPTFKQELTDLINKHSLENSSNTPDYIITEYLVMCYGAYCEAVSANVAHSALEKAI